MNTIKGTKPERKHTAWILVLALVCILTATAIWITHGGEGGIQIAGDAYYAGSFLLEGYFGYHQMDKKWAGNPLGEVRDTMSSLGCLACYIAAFLKGQGIYDYAPGQLNQLFNDHGVYNESGAVIWENLERALPGVTVDLDGQMSGTSINRMIEQREYSTVKVRRKSGAVHWIILTETEGDSYDIIAMDPTNKCVHLSNYVDTIYNVRVVTGGSY